MRTIFFAVLLSFIADIQYAKNNDLELLAVVISDGRIDQLRRYEFSANSYKLNYKVLTYSQPWRDSDVKLYSDGGYKVNILKENLAEFADRENLVLLYTDSLDTVFVDSSTEILKKFKAFDSRVVFASDDLCWPDNTLKSMYPTIGPIGKRYLNAGAFMGYAKDVVEMVNHRPINDMESDQLYYSDIFINRQLRGKWAIRIDTKSSIFQNFLGSTPEVLEMKSRDHNYIYNRKTTNKPSVIYSSGGVMTPSDEAKFLRLADYLTGSWMIGNKCPSCDRDVIRLDKIKEKNYPKVLLSIFIEQPTPFMPEALELIGKLEYPKSKIDLFIYYHTDYHEVDVADFISEYGHDYNSKTIVSPEDQIDLVEARQWSLKVFKEKKCQYYFSVEGYVHLSNSKTLKQLIAQNRSVIAPMLSQYGKYWSNFWCGLCYNGYYERTDDYIEIIERKRRGLWNVPYITAAYLVNSSIIDQIQDCFINNGGSDLSLEMVFAENLRKKGIFMYVTNTKDFGHLIDFDDYDTSHLHNDLWQISKNEYNWKKRYIHENYSKSLEPDTEIEMPCNDVAWFPVMSDTFCNHMIEEMENYGLWSDGKNEDPRVGGYENVPTVDIHMNQIGYHDEWLYFLKHYASPLQQKVFLGYNHESPRALMNFVVRYRPDEQPLLRPHHDVSTWTINIALNRPGIDYTGGGVRFIRQNCSITETKKGWMFIHPGRLTHFHEGLKVKSGTRYILVSFVDP